MAARAEGDELRRVVQFGLALVILTVEPSDIQQHGRWRSPTRQRRNRAGLFHIVDHRRLHHETGHGLTCQMSAAYSAIVRSLENLPEASTSRMSLRAHAFESV